jgi:curli production assembly/transport component CsgG/holdfast attachment protein HfaB
MVRLPAYICVALAAGLAGCTALTPLDEDVAPVVGPAPRLNTTPMATALACMRSQQSSRDLRIGVSDFVDGTGVMEGGTQNSRAVTQRPDMMMVVALAAAGAHLVNRSSINVSEWEMNKAMEKKLGDGSPEVIDRKQILFRPIRAGIILGSTHYVTGAVTELNWNIDSGVAEAGAYSANIGRRTYRISVAIDVVVTDTQTTEIVYAKSFKKQLVGFESNANFFRFVNENTALQILSLGNTDAAAVTQELELFDANLDEKQNEPSQTALRWVIELAAYDIMRDLKRTGNSCDSLLPPQTFDDGVVPPDAAGAAASGASQAPPLGRVSDASPEQAATKPEISTAQDSGAAGVSVPATEQPVVEARAEAEAPKQAEAASPPPAAAPVADEPARGSASKRRRRASEVAAAEKTPPAASQPAPKGERKSRAKSASRATASDATSAEAPTAPMAGAEATPTASTEKSSENAQPQPPSIYGAAPVGWISGAFPALAPELSQDGSERDLP